MSIFNPDTDKKTDGEDPTPQPDNRNAPDADQENLHQTPQQESALNSPTLAGGVGIEGDRGSRANTPRRKRGDTPSPDQLRKMSAEQLDKRVAEAITNLDNVMQAVTQSYERLKREASVSSSSEPVSDDGFERTAGQLIRAHRRLSENLRLRRAFERDKVSRQGRNVFEYVLSNASLSADKVEEAMKLVRAGQDAASVLAALFGTTGKE